MARKDIINGQSYNQGFYNANDNFIELYNMANDIFPFRGAVEANTPLTALQQGSYVNFNSGWIHKPSEAGVYGIITVVKNSSYAQIEYLDSDNRIFKCFGNVYEGTFNNWVKVITSAPHSFNMTTLQSGWAGGIYYGKNQSNQLILASNSLLNGTTAWGTTIATLPEGYRPLYNTPIDFYSTAGRVISGFVLLSDGKINIYDPAVANLPTTSGQMILMVNTIINLY